MIEINREEITRLLHYDPETGLFTRKVALCNKVKVGDIAGTVDEHGYVRIRVGSCRPIRAHRLAWFYVYGYWPFEIDHINGDCGDNRIANLREVTSKQNAENRKLNDNNKTGHQGVYWVEREQKYKAQVGHGRELHHLGTYTTIEEAAKATREFRRTHFTHNNREVNNGKD